MQGKRKKQNEKRKKKQKKIPELGKDHRLGKQRIQNIQSKGIKQKKKEDKHKK